MDIYDKIIKDKNNYNRKDYRDGYLLLLFIVILVLYIVFNSPVYIYGISDHNEQLPSIKHMLDNSFLENDWATVNNNVPESPRFNYFKVISCLASLIGLESTVFILWLIFMLVSITFIYKITYKLFSDRLVSVITIGFFLMPNMISLGGNNLLSKMLVPSLIANALVLVSFYLILNKRRMYAFLILALCSLIHISIAFWSTFAVVIYILMSEYIKRRSRKQLSIRNYIKGMPVTSFIIFILILVIGNYNVILSNLGSVNDFEGVKIMAWVRHPHHYIPGTWSFTSMLPYFIILFIFFGLLFINAKNNASVYTSKRGELFSLSIIAVFLFIMFIGGFIFTEIIPVSSIIKLQPFHVDYLPVLFIISYIMATGINIMKSFLKAHGIYNYNLIVLLFVVLLIPFWIAISVLGFGGSGIEKKIEKSSISNIQNLEIYQKNSYPEELSEMYNWIGEYTDRDAVFLISPAIPSFRLGAERAIVVDQKTFLFIPQDMTEWYSRINLLCDRTKEEILGYKALSGNECQERYNNLSEKEIMNIAQKFNVSYIVTENNHYSNLKKIYQNEKYLIYKVSEKEKRLYSKLK